MLIGVQRCCELKSRLTPLFVGLYTFSMASVTAVVMWWELVQRTAIVEGCRFNLCRRWRLNVVAGAFSISTVIVVLTTLLTWSGNSKSFHSNLRENHPKTLYPAVFGLGKWIEADMLPIAGGELCAYS